MDKLVMEIKDYHSINHAIEINKINVVGGVNGSGKSSVSRMFYSFLKANSIDRKDFILKEIINRTNYFLDSFNEEFNEYNLPQKLTINDDLSYINHTLDEIFELSKDFGKRAISKKQEFIKKFKEVLSKNEIDITDFEDKFDSIIKGYIITFDVVDELLDEYNINSSDMPDSNELRNLWSSFKEYSSIQGKCLDIYSQKDEFLKNDDYSLSEKILNRILLKEHISVNAELDLKLIINEINRIIDVMNIKRAYGVPIYLIEEIKFDLPNIVSIDDSLSHIIRTLNILLITSKDFVEIANLKKNELKKEFLSKFDSIIKLLISKNIDVSDVERALYSTNDDEYVDSLAAIHFIFEDFDLYRDYSDDFYELNGLVDAYNYFNMYSDIYDKCVAIDSILHEFLDVEKLSQKSINELMVNGNIKHDNLCFSMLSQESDPFKYFYNNFINSVYYVDNVSIFDINHQKMYLTNRLFHMDEIINDIYGDTYTYEMNDDFTNIMEKIDKMIMGRYSQNFPYFYSHKKNDPLSIIGDMKTKRFLVYGHIDTNIETDNTTTSSGIKQIGIIQLLLLNNKLKKDGYLIIDEPEVNLHPDWQFKFAEILVLLAKDLNITIYLNSHSPTFIESIDAFTEFYDMQDDINYYLTEESDVEGKYNFIKISSDELYKIYDNLGNAYDLIDQLRLKKHLGV